jgi:hypothetical protein
MQKDKRRSTRIDSQIKKHLEDTQLQETNEKKQLQDAPKNNQHHRIDTKLENSTIINTEEK